jgi:phenylacetate-CoA ligase
MEAPEARHRDAFEGWEPAAQRALVDAKLRDLVALAAARSPLYGGLWGEPGSFGGLGDLGRLPLLTKDVWVAASPPRSSDALTGPLTDALVLRSGGSTGEPKFSIYSHSEFAGTMPFFARTYRAAGLVPGDRVANLFAAGALYASFSFVNRLLETLGCLSFPYTAAADAEIVADGCARFGIDVLVGFPSRLLHVAPALQARGVRIAKIFYAGEHLHPEDRQRLTETLGCSVIASAGYGAVDSGLMGHACEARAGGFHHVLADHVVVEVVDPETGRPKRPGEAGSLVVTNLDRHLQPVIRYVIGDEGRLVPEACPCGRATPVFELLGRTDDALRLGYATVLRAEVLAAFADEPAVGQAVQLVKQRHDGREALRIRVEVAEHGRDETLQARLEAALLQAKPDVAKLIAAGSLAPLAVELLAPGGIPLMPVTGKFKGTIDETL